MKKLIAGLLLALTMPILLGSEVGPAYATTSAVTITTATSRISYLRLVNSGGGTSVSCVLKDRTTNCGGSGCPIYSAAFTADPQTYSDPQPGTLATNGFTISCTAGNAVSYYIQYATPQ